MITATTTLCSRTPTMIATTMRTTASAPSTSRRSAGVFGSGLGGPGRGAASDGPGGGRQPPLPQDEAVSGFCRAMAPGGARMLA